MLTLLPALRESLTLPTISEAYKWLSELPRNQTLTVVDRRNINVD